MQRFFCEHDVSSTYGNLTGWTVSVCGLIEVGGGRRYSLEHELQEEKYFCLFHSQLHIQHLGQCLARVQLILLTE